jgi:flagellar hook protein FlgE
MNIGVAALNAESQSLSVTSSNIANLNTVGYKNSTINFSSYLNSTIGSNNSSAAGVTANVSQDVTAQGLATTTTSPTDLSISGNGFFVVSPTASATGTQEYTRAGSFTPDADGNLVNSSGNYLLGWQLDSSGNVPTDTTDLSLINVSAISGKAQASTTASLTANLDSTATVDSSYTAGDMTAGTATPDYQNTINVYNGQGGVVPISMAFIKTGANTWAYEASYAGASSNITGSNPIAEGTMSFNADGTLANADTSASTPTGNISLTIPWSAASGLGSQTISVNMGTVGTTSGVTQFDAASSLSSSENGSPFGNVTGVSVGTDGTVTAQFSNGLSQAVYKVPVATFANEDGLAPVSGNAYTATQSSGSANVNLAASGSAGSIQSKSLEGSTVDLSTEFTNLITAQNAYGAAARIITTADQMMQTLEQVPTQ